MKKIAFFIPSMYPTGGAELTVHELAEELQKSHEVTVITMGENTFNNCSYRKTSLNYSTSIFSKIITTLRGHKDLEALCKKHAFDVLISNLERPNFITLRTRLPALKKIVVVHNSHSLWKIHTRLLIKWLYKRATHVVTVSKGIERILQEEFGLSNVLTIYNPINLEESTRLAGEPLLEKDASFFSKKIFTFVTIGRLVPIKNQNKIIQAFHKLQQEQPLSQLLIIGSGPRKRELERLIKKLDLGGHVFLLGSRENVFSILKRSDCFIFNSSYEGFGRVLVEAASTQTRIITSDFTLMLSSAMNEVVKDKKKPHLIDLSLFSHTQVIESWQRLIG